MKLSDKFKKVAIGVLLVGGLGTGLTAEFMKQSKEKARQDRVTADVNEKRVTKPEDALPYEGADGEKAAIIIGFGAAGVGGICFAWKAGSALRQSFG